MTRALVTGGAGFVGSHLCERLLAEGWEVVCYDTLLTGNLSNLDTIIGKPSFTFENRDVTKFLELERELDWIFHFASPASPYDYLAHPIHTMKLGALGTLNCLGLAKAKGASFLVASTSEVYGDPKVNPQPESYWGHVNPVGPRAVYDEAKRFAEAMTMAYRRTHGIDARIIRIFNTYGPRMQQNDGRAVPTFVRQALAGGPVPVHGEGTQTRSLCYVDDLIEGIWRVTASDLQGPVNLGNPREVTMLELAELIVSLSGRGSTIEFEERPVDDPEVRCPDISLARSELDWEPKIGLEVGLRRTLEWAGQHWGRSE